LCDGGRFCPTLDNFPITRRFAIKAFVAGLIRFQGCTIQAETSESALGVTVKENFRVGIVVGRLAISPCGRSVRADCEPIGQQLRTAPFVQRQDYDVDCFASDLDAQAAAFQGEGGGRRPAAGIPAGDESTSVARTDNRSALLKLGNNGDAIGSCDLFLPNAVPGGRHHTENVCGSCDPPWGVIRACRRKSRRDRQKNEVVFPVHRVFRPLDFNNNLQ